MSERLLSLAKNLFKFYKRPEQLQKFKKQLKPFTNRFNQFVIYSAAFYNWDEQGITDQEIKNTIDEFVFTSKVYFDQRNRKQQIDCPIKKNQQQKSVNNEMMKDEWEAVIIKEYYQVWRKKLDDKSGVYRYKVFGTFHDIPARTFFNVQMDTEYRKKWDSLIVKLNFLDKQNLNEQINFNKPINDVDFFDTGNEVLQWVMKYPYPMYSREYCYIRRAIVCKKENLIVLISKSCDHPKCQELSDRGSIRVREYESQMVIRPHKSFDENGFDYLLTYFDDPRTYLSVTCYNWIASSGLPGFVDSMHQAAIELNKQNKSDHRTSTSTHRKFNQQSNQTTKSNLNNKSSSLNSDKNYVDVAYN